MKELFEKAIKSNDTEEILDFLMVLNKSIKKEYLPFIRFFMDNLDDHILEKVKLNLIHLMGELGKEIPLTNTYMDFLRNNYFTSDRWVRNEIIIALNKIATQEKLSTNIFEVLRYAIHDDYISIKMNALKLLLTFDALPDFVIINILRALKRFDLEIIEPITNVLQKFVQNEKHLFDLLNADDNYKTLSKKTFRTIIIACFDSVMVVESFREIISKSKWDDEIKESFLSEIETFERILLKKR